MGEKKNIVLFVDDENHILSAIRRATADEAFESLFAGSGREALQVFAEHEISVIITDMRMPGMDGLALLKIIREQYPETVRMVLSGYTQLSQVLATVNQGDIFRYIPKPWEMEEELLSAVRQAIDRYNLGAERDSLREGLELKNQAYLNIFREMEQKFANEKKDLASLKRVHRWLFAFWKKQLAMCSGRVDDDSEAAAARYVDLIELIQQNYLDMLPTTFAQKVTAKMIADISKACEGRLVINSVRKVDIDLSGHYDFLQMALKTLLGLVPDDQTVLCDMMVDVKEEGLAVVAFVISLKLFKLPAGMQSHIKIACSLLSEMGGAYNTKIIPEVAQGELVAIRVNWLAEQ
ncbi:MAG: response regulator [Negativicutes bacterium]|nr:response regulator [Negativicutes bacterium]